MELLAADAALTAALSLLAVAATMAAIRILPWRPEDWALRSTPGEAFKSVFTPKR
jgi:hypothetical protein